MQLTVLSIKQMFHQLLRVVFVAIALFSLWQQPSYATHLGSDQLSADEKLERAYDGFSEDAGIREEIVQEKLDRGENLKSKQPRPFQRITDLEGKEVPKTSLVETTVTKIRDLVEDK